MSWLHTALALEDGDTYSDTIDKPLVSLARSGQLPFNYKREYMQAVITSVKQRLVEGTTGFYYAPRNSNKTPLNQLSCFCCNYALLKQLNF